MVKDASNTMKGNFTYVGLDIDTTGLRLIDEIVNVAAYTTNAQYSQHIMPLMNLNPGARQRHQIRVINVGCFRMLKSMQTYKVIKTKTEIAALLDFLDWLETVNTNDGIIFVYHDKAKFTPYMMIEAMKKYRLMERFEKVVKSFVNGYDLPSHLPAEKQEGLKYVGLSQNYKIQREQLGMESIEINEFEGDATVRAKFSYDICMLMAHCGEKKEVDEKAMAAIVNNYIRPKAKPIAGELEEIKEQEECIKRQSSLRDIFRGYFQTSRYHRRRGVTFRRLLAEAKQDMESLTAVWAEGKREAIADHINKLEDLKEEDREELIEILDCHFDPEKKPVKPVVQRRENNENRGDNRVDNRGGNRDNNRDGNRDNNRDGNSDRRDDRGGNQRNQQRRRRGPRGRSLNKENQGGPRMDNRRKRSPEKRYSNNNNNAVMDPKSGAIRKDQQVDANQNTVLVAAN